MAKAGSNLVIGPIMAPDVAVVVLIIVAQVMSCKGLIQEANVLGIFAGALLCMTHLLACLLAACFISQLDDTRKACLHRQRTRNALVGAWIAFVTTILALVAALPPHSQCTCCGDGRMVFAEMVKAGGIFVCILILALDIGAGILGLEAGVQENKVKHLRMWIFECRQPSQGAFKLGLGAGVLLCVAHVLANLLGGCNNCICSQDDLQKASPNRQLTMACLIFTWVIFAIGLSMLVIGTLSNEKSKASCGFTHHHFMSIGGILCFVHGLFSIAYYVSATATQ